ncbi:MAG: phospho-N-acetylmuramoyl-pentapeptide-transferase [Clostridia bacterium]|nr:phospho-N-acetylmuramoyl-pentapeptide-transferase [Clostridia bacterium]
MESYAITFAVVAPAVFILTALFLRFLIPVLKSRKIGQKILDIGPRWHKSKEGTPIMGGIGFILPSLLVAAGFFLWQWTRGESASYIPLALTLAFAVMNGAIGFVDDYFKLIKKQNEGLTAKQKLFLQFVIAGAYLCVLSYTGHFETAWQIPFTDFSLELGWFSYPIALVLLVGVVNGGNLTDGIDGLASSVTCVIGGFFALLAFCTMDSGLSVLSGILIGATLGFLIYNFHPAKVFMGDTGSLFLGALVIGGAFQIGAPLVGILLSMVFLLEMLSSFLQIFYFRLTHGKRLFRMAPVHHHFEKCGWSEYRIVAVFSFVELLFCVLAWFAL